MVPHLARSPSKGMVLINSEDSLKVMQMITNKATQMMKRTNQVIIDFKVRA